MALRYKTLQSVPVNALFNCFTKAFADYQVPVNMDLERFETMNIMRGFDPAVSIGAFDGDKLAGFVLSGTGDWKGESAAYDMGTGTLPAYRGCGVGTLMIAALEKELRQHPHRLYLLEVLKENAPAVALYKKSGFTITRGLLCFQNQEGLSVIPAAASSVEIKSIPPLSREECANFQDWEPSWQNSGQALARCLKPLVWLGAFLDGALAGYGVISATGGLIFQLAVQKSCRRKGLGRALLRAMAQTRPAEKPELKILNIDESDLASVAFFKANGFCELVAQYEMQKRLR